MSKIVMAGNYYYLVTGLPEIAVDSARKGISWLEFFDEIQGQIDGDDAELLELIRYPYDNRNLMILLEKRDDPLDPRGNFSRETLLEEIRYPEILPAYMKTFLEAYKTETFPFAGLLPEDQLAWMFYEEMTSHGNDFIRGWYSFELDLRNVLAGSNYRTLQHQTPGNVPSYLHLNRVIVGRNDVAEQIMKSNSPDFGLSKEHDWVEEVLAFGREDLVQFEKDVDMLRWEKLDGLTTNKVFSIETILSFCLKLSIVERWHALDPEAGKQILSRLLSDIASAGGKTDRSP